MLASNFELLRHILDEVNFVLQTTQGKTKDEVINDGILCRAIVRSLEIIGEATKKLDAEFTATIRTLSGKKWQEQEISSSMIILVWIMILFGILWKASCRY